jgi:hypothetical protein
LVIRKPYRSDRKRRRVARWIDAFRQAFDHRAERGWCYHHVQAIIVSVDRYAEAATGNRHFFLSKPQSIG